MKGISQITFIFISILCLILSSGCSTTQESTQAQSDTVLAQDTTTSAADNTTAQNESVLAAAKVTITSPPAKVMTENELVIQGMLKTLEVLNSKDATKIREYQAAATSNPDDRAEILKMSDKDILETAEFVVSLTDWTEADLRSSETKFTRNGEEMEVELKSGDIYYAYIVDGIWY